MGSGIYIATAGAVAQANALDVTASNIANASTSGFKGARISFRQALASAQSPDTAMVGSGTGGVDSTTGSVAQTGNPLDVAISGDGFFAVDTPRGVRFTRDGSFQLNDAGKLVTADGLTVRGQGGSAITVPKGSADVSIDGDGNVRAGDQILGTLDLVHLDRAGLTHDQDNLVASKLPPIGGDPPKLVSGSLEGSNINVVRGVVDLVKVSRAYESLMKVIEGYHEIETRAAQTIGAPK